MERFCRIDVVGGDRSLGDFINANTPDVIKSYVGSRCLFHSIAGEFRKVWRIQSGRRRGNFSLGVVGLFDGVDQGLKVFVLCRIGGKFGKAV